MNLSSLLHSLGSLLHSLWVQINITASNVGDLVRAVHPGWLIRPVIAVVVIVVLIKIFRKVKK